MGLNSKNNAEDAEEAFRHPHMLMSTDGFVSMKINWNNKALNIKDMESELNLTEGSFVFIDDNPIEQETVKTGCPEVAVPKFPDDTVGLPEFIERVYREHFQTLHTTAEDKSKTTLYQAESERKKVEAVALDLDSYIKALEITADIHIMKDAEIERVHQLVNKTNQFNLTTKRYTLENVRRMHEDTDIDIFTVTTSDKFGDNGLVAVVIMNLYPKDIVSTGSDEKADRTVYIDTFLMSCRVMGRKLENVIMDQLMKYYGSNYDEMNASYIRTTKNKPVEDLYDRLGFKQIDDGTDEKRYRIKLAEAKVQNAPYKSVVFNDEVMA